MPPKPSDRLLDLASHIALYPGGPMLTRAAVAACLALAACGAALEWLDGADLPAAPERSGPAWAPFPAPATLAADTLPDADAAPRAGASSLRVVSTHVMADAAGEAALTLLLRRGAEADVRLRVEGAQVEAATGPARVPASGAAGVELLGSGTVHLALEGVRPERPLRLRLVDAQGHALDGTAVELAVLPMRAAAPLTVALGR